AFVVIFFLSATLCSARIWTPVRIQENRTRGHAFWHNIWAGLGEYENPYGFQIGDQHVRDYVAKIDPQIPALSPPYEAALRKNILETIGHHPFWYAGVLAKRTWGLISRWTEILPWGEHLPSWLGALVFLLSAGWVIFRVMRGYDERIFLQVFP